MNSLSKIVVVDKGGVPLWTSRFLPCRIKHLRVPDHCV
jgi:hypothetical protein